MFSTKEIVEKDLLTQDIPCSEKNLSHLTDQALHQDMLKLAKCEREILSQVITHIQEVAKRKLFSALGYSSLYDYLTRGLKYSEGSAQRRITAARLSREIPEILPLIETGSVTLAQMSLVESACKQQSAQEKKEIIQEMRHKTLKESEKVLEQKKIIKHQKSILVVDEETLELLKELQNLSIRSPDKATLLKTVLKQEIERRKSVKFKTLKRNKAPDEKEVPKNTKNIPAATRRFVFRRDLYKCVRCGSQKNLQLDHIYPQGLEVDHSPENLRVYCHHCNQRARLEMKFVIKRQTSAIRR